MSSDDNSDTSDTSDTSAHADIEARPGKAKPYKFVVRLPIEMRDRIAEASQRHRRSMNSEIVSRLEQTFSGIPSDDSQNRIEPQMQPTFDAFMRRDLREEERELLRTFRRLTSAKRKALLSLLK